MHLVEKGMAIWGTENLQSGESGNVLGDEIRRRSKTHQEKPGLKDGKRALAICCPRLSSSFSPPKWDFSAGGGGGGGSETVVPLPDVAT